MSRSIRKITAVLLCAVIVFSAVLSAGGEDVRVSAAAPYIESEDFIGLKDAFADYFKIGVAMPARDSWYLTDNNNRARTVKSIFNSLTTENEFKPESNFNKDAEKLYKAGNGGDGMLKFCDANGIKMRYHVLVWHSQVNPSIFAKDFKATVGGAATTNSNANLDADCLVDKDTLIERLKTYIYGAMEYVYSNGFADTVYAFDVVNEAVDEGKDDGLRRSYWYKIIGPEFLYYSFLFAREAELTYSRQYAGLYGLDPEGDLSSITPKLFYNDYNEWFPARVRIITDFTTKQVWNAGQSMVKSFAIKADGDGTMIGDGLIDGIGMQGHLSDNNVIDQYISALEAYNEAVGEVQITELDVGCTHHDDNRWFYQAKFYYDLFTRLVAAREAGVNLTSVTLWGLSDEMTWRSGDDPLVLYGDLSKKPSYDAMLLAAEKKDFNMTLADTMKDLEDIDITFEPTASMMYTPEKAGFYARGTGHRPIIEMAPQVNHTPDAITGLSVVCRRNEQDATIQMDASKFSGKNVTFTAYVKTTDKTVRIGLETGETTPVKEIGIKNDDWHVISANFDIPEGKSSVYIYFETDGSADLYIDDVSMIYTREGKEPAPVVTDGNEEPEQTEQPGKNVTETPGTENTATENNGEKAPGSNTDNGTQQESTDNGDDQGSGTLIGVIAVVAVAALAVAAIYILRKRGKKA